MKVKFNEWKDRGHKLYIVHSTYPTGKHYFGFATEEHEGYCNITQDNHLSEADVIILDADFVKTGYLAKKFIKTYCKKICENTYKVNLNDLLLDATEI